MNDENSQGLDEEKCCRLTEIKPPPFEKMKHS